MKSAEELWRSNTSKRHGGIMTYTEFVPALTEHDKEIVAKIDEMIEEYEAEYSLELSGGREGDPSYPSGKITALTELKQWMEK